MLGGVEESQENTEVMRRHEAQGRFWLLRQAILKKTNTDIIHQQLLHMVTVIKGV